MFHHDILADDCGSVTTIGLAALILMFCEFS